jgi:hypothetical protein
VETTRRIYRIAPDSDSLFAMAGDGEPLTLRLETRRPHLLRAEARGFKASEDVSLELLPGETSRELTIPVAPYEDPNATVALTVESGDSVPVEAVRIELRGVGDASGPTYGKAEKAGSRVELDVPADRYWCRVSSPDGAPAWPTQLIELDLAGGETHTLFVVAPAGGTVRVLLPRDHRTLHVQFSVRPVPDKRTYALYERRGVPVDWRGEFRAVGDFVRVATLAPGPHTIGVSSNTGRKRWERNVTVVAGETVELDFSDDLRGFLDRLRREVEASAR